MNIKHELENTLYNLDRTVASAFGAPAQETISSEIGRHESNPLDKVAAEILDAIQPEHCENAVKHADALEKVDNGFIG